jgi:nitronate monooxygenase
MSPMTGASPVSLAVAVANAGGVGACGTSLMSPQAIASWASEFRKESAGPFQMNVWLPNPAHPRDFQVEERQREFLNHWGPEVPAEAGNAPQQDFEEQCIAVIDAKPTVISSLLGVFPPALLASIKAKGILWFATATTVTEAKEAEEAGADAIIVQGAEAGGHRGTFNASNAELEAVGLFSLLPQVCDGVSVPVIAAGGISDGRTIAAALVLGASAVQIGTGLLRTPEAKTHPVWARMLGEIGAHDTRFTRAFSGRSGRVIRNRFVDAAASSDAPPPASFPVQRSLAFRMMDEARSQGDPERLPMWAGQSAPLAKELPIKSLIENYWCGALDHLG